MKKSLLTVVVVVAALAPTASASAAPPTKPNFTIGDEPCRLIGVPAASPYAYAPCPGVRPGGLVNTPKGQCTLNFIFAGSDGRRYIGTAGHCVLGTQLAGGENAGERYWAAGQGPVARDSKGARIGEFAYAVLQNPKDFALVRLDPWIPGSPQICHFGGPTGTYTYHGPDWRYVGMYGNGLAYSAVSPARTHIAGGTPHPDHVLATGLAASGDSGAPVITTEGGAVGLAVAYGYYSGTNEGGTILITRIGPQRARAAQVMGVGLSLQTAGLL